MAESYTEALTFLDNLQMHKVKLGLGAMRSFLADIGQPEKQLHIVHVAGTNGKGSVSASLLRILQLSGYRIGLYTSPHLSCVRERFRINDTFISEADFARIAATIRDVLGQETITYFEFTTALALLWFAESDLDLVILETGLGGRLDATNVVTPLVALITSISMDHEAYLGTTLQQVAAEKAGIIKPGVPVITADGEQQVLEVLRDAAQKHKAPLYQLGRDFTYAGESNEHWSWTGSGLSPGTTITDLQCSMRGAYQRENGSLAVAASMLLRQQGFSIADNTIREALKSVVWPGRLEFLRLERISRRQLTSSESTNSEVVCYLLDGAHNPAGVRNLARTLSDEYRYRRLFVVWGAMVDKDIAGGFSSIIPLADMLILTRPDGERSAEPAQLAACLPEAVRSKAVLARDVGSALEEAESRATSEDLIVVAGSLYLVGAVRSQLIGEVVST